MPAFCSIVGKVNGLQCYYTSNTVLFDKNSKKIEKFRKIKFQKIILVTCF